MSHVSDLSELSSVLSYYVSVGDISKERALELEKKIKSLIIPSEISSYFINIKGRVLNEREMMDASGKLLRPDRCVVYNDKIVVIDYKTGTPHDSHKEQVKQYVNLGLELGYKSTEAYLIYFSDGKIEKLKN
jgi:CRISPR/Cas system-associated exonuclease Cas4 (RecB family)